MGRFIALEGTDGSGKSTIAARLAEALQARGCDVLVTREPGGTAIGEQIRDILFDSTSSAMFPETEALLFAAARAQHVMELIRPALERGTIVISDRFVDSSFAYQAGGRGLPMDAVVAAQNLAMSGLQPDLKLLLDLPVAVGLQRRLGDHGQGNRLDKEGLQFHTRVRDVYLALAAGDPERWRVIDAARSEDEVWRDVWAAVSILDLSDTNCSPLDNTCER